MNLSFDFLDSRVVNGLRIKQAREKALLTQAGLAKAVSVSQPMIAHIEQGLKQCSSELADKIAESTGMRREFLCRSSGPTLPLGSMLFRARADTSAKKFAQTHAIANIVLEIFVDLAEKFQLPSVKLQPIAATPEEAAARTRTMLGLDDSSPIPHLMRAFEKAGGVILALPELEGREAFAVWEGNRPIIGIGPSANGDRLRFSMAHEIGHLILHNSPTAMAQAEKEAHRFAGELLAPREAFVRDLSGPLTFEKLGLLKRKWGIAMSAILFRARELQIITRRIYDRLTIELAPYRTQEPPEYWIPVEKPRALRQMAEVLFGSTLMIESIAEKLSLSSEFVSDILNRYASSQEIAVSNRKRKVVNIQSARKHHDRNTESNWPILTNRSTMGPVG